MTHSTACTRTPNASAGPCSRQSRRPLGAPWLSVSASSTNPSSTWLTSTGTRRAAATPKPSRAPSAFPLNGSRLEKANPSEAAASHSTSALHYTTASALRANSLRDWNASHKHWKTARAGTSGQLQRARRRASLAANDAWQSRQPLDPPAASAEDRATANRPVAKCQWPPLRLTWCPLGVQLLWTFPCDLLKHALRNDATILYRRVSMLSP